MQVANESMFSNLLS